MSKLGEIWHYRFYAFSRLFKSLSVLIIFYQLLDVICPLEQAPPILKIIALCLIVFVCILYSVSSLLFPPKEVTLDINKKTQLLIKQGDVMKAQGVKVIPVNEYFDTHKGDGIVNEKSLHGQFLSYYDGRIDELRKKIDKQLDLLVQLPWNRTRTMVSGLPQRRYPLGSCVKILDGESCFLLVAVTRFDKYEHVDVSTEEFPEVIRKMFNGIEQLHDGMPVFLPLIGSGLSGYNLTNMQIMYLIVQAAQLANRLSLTNGIYLCIYDEKQMKSINLSVIKYLYNRWKKLK